MCSVSKESGRCCEILFGTGIELSGKTAKLVFLTIEQKHTSPPKKNSELAIRLVFIFTELWKETNRPSAVATHLADINPSGILLLSHDESFLVRTFLPTSRLRFGSHQLNHTSPTSQMWKKKILWIIGYLSWNICIYIHIYIYADMSIHIYDYQVNHFVHMYSWEVFCLPGSSSILGTHLSPLIWMYSKLVVKVLEWGWFGSLSYESTYQPWAIKYYSSYDLCGIATRTSYLAGDFFGGGNKRLLYIYANSIF